MTTAACLIIGDEILSGKVRDTNAHLLIDLLHEIGVALRRIATLPDIVEEIAEEVRRCAEQHDYVFTSGGIGPTHDDRTIEAIALAFAVPVVRHPELEARVRQHWGPRLTDAALKMAEIPEGARLLRGTRTLLPALAFRNIFILPGVPQLFAEKLAALRAELTGTREFLQSLYLSSDESAIAALLSQVVAGEPAVRIGSYPKIGDPDHRVRITIESSDPDAVERAATRLLELLPPEQVLRRER
jgi:molybdenum cofactor synthesis domain-containing protein